MKADDIRAVCARAYANDHVGLFLEKMCGVFSRRDLIALALVALDQADCKDDRALAALLGSVPEENLP